MIGRLIAQIAIVFCGIIVAGVFLNLYMLPLSWLTIYVLGVDSQVVFRVEYWICFAAAFVTAFFLMRKIWPAKSQRTPKP